MADEGFFVHPSADVHPAARIGAGTRIWHQVHVREEAIIGRDCVLGKDVYVDRGVVIGDRVKVQNGVSLYRGVVLEDDVFVGPHVAFTNDRFPRSFVSDWQVVPTRVRRGASIGANATIICGVTIGEYAMLGAGAVVTRDIPPYALAYGNPARVVGRVDERGRRVTADSGWHAVERPGRWVVEDRAPAASAATVEAAGDPIPLSRPLLGEEEREAVAAVLASGQLAAGPVVRAFEASFAAFVGARHAVATSSGTTALVAALVAHGIGPGDEVITTPFTFAATANAVLLAGARPVFADIDPATFNLDPRQVAARITPRTKAVIAVHLFGHPCDMDALAPLCRETGLALIEDACQAHGASYRGRRVGSFGTGCFSFYGTKNMVTGEGGMVTTGDDEVARRVRMVINHGMAVLYRHEMLGSNYRLTDLQAAIGLVQLRRLPEFTARRQANARFLMDRLEGVGLPVIREGCEHVFHQFTVRVPRDRDGLAAHLERAGVGCAVHYPCPLHRQPLYRGLGYADALPAAEEASRTVLSLPVGPFLERDDLERIVGAVNAWTRGRDEGRRRDDGRHPAGGATSAGGTAGFQ